MPFLAFETKLSFSQFSDNPLEHLNLVTRSWRGEGRMTPLIFNPPLLCLQKNDKWLNCITN